MTDADDEADDAEESIDDLFPFTLAEQSLVERIASTVRERMSCVDPDTLRKIAAVLHALERLPYVTPDVSLDLALMRRVDQDLSYVSVEMDSLSFRLSTGGYVFTPGVGGDSFSTTTFEIEAGGFRGGSTEDMIDWLDAFIASDGTIEVQGDFDADLADAAPDDGWERLEKYWESRGGDTDGW